jgi:trk system potassium uptake protein TrkH
MNYRILSRYLGIITLLVGASMLLSIPWTMPTCGAADKFESEAFWGLLGSITIAVTVAAMLLYWGRHPTGKLYRKEAMATVGLGWILAALLGALPFLLSGVHRDADTKMTLADAFFESASGFSGTGATVISDLENSDLVPRSILFWRSETHFLGGLGIMVLFVAILGMGSAGKALMLAEMPGPNPETGQSRVQHAAWAFTGIYLGLNALLIVALLVQRVSFFDAICHSFGTIATGGFSTYNDSVAHFNDVGIEMTIAVFMVLACTNFALLYALLIGKPSAIWQDAEFRVYLAILLAATLLLVAFGIRYQDFSSLSDAFRYGFFQVASILTNTGFATHNFDTWNEIGRGTLFLLMFIGGCAGSTSCSIKIVRHILFVKIVWIELEHAWRPSVVRTLRLSGKPISDPAVRQNVLVYFGLLLMICVSSWLLLDMFEPDQAWTEMGHARHEKLIDCASGVGATVNGVGPGLGTIGAVENYGHFQPASKLLFVFLMMIGRLEIFPVLVLLLPRFWRNH